MIILKINRLIARHGKLAMILIAAAVVIPFVFMWGPHSVFDSGPGRRQITDAGTMYGEEISPDQLFRQLRFAQLAEMERTGEMTPITRGEQGQRLLEQALERMRLLHEAEERGLDKVSDSQIDQQIGMMFQDQEGRFNRQYYELFSRRMLPQLGMDELDYRDYVRERIAINRLHQQVISGVFVSPLEVEHQLRRNHEKFRAAYRTFDLAEFREQAETRLVSDSEVRSYFDANRGSELLSGKVITELDEETKSEIRQHLLKDIGEEFYQHHIEFLKPYVEEKGDLEEALAAYINELSASPSPDEEQFPFSPQQAREKVDNYIREVYEPERRKYTLAIFEPDDYLEQVEITEADMLAAYSRAEDQYQKQVTASHILIRPENRNDEAAQTEAREKAEELRQRIIEDDEDFSALAREYSDDPGTAQRGGELGTFTRDQMVEPFAEAAFALEEGEISEVIQTQFGLHLIKVEEIIPRRELAEVEDELREQERRRAARRRAWTAADDFAYNIYEAAAGQGIETKTEVAKEMAEAENIRTVETDYFNPRRLPELLAGHEEAAQTVYNLTRNQAISDVIELNDRSAVALYRDSRPAEIPAFEDQERVQQLAIEWARREKARELAQTNAAQIAAEIKEKFDAENLEEKVLVEDFDFTTTEHFTRQSPPAGDSEFREMLLGRLDEQSVGSLSEPLEGEDKIVLVCLTERIPPEEEITEQQREMARRQAYSRKAQWAIESFNEQTRQRAQTEISEELLAHIGRR